MDIEKGIKKTAAHFDKKNWNGFIKLVGLVTYKKFKTQLNFNHIFLSFQNSHILKADKRAKSTPSSFAHLQLNQT